MFLSLFGSSPPPPHHCDRVHHGCSAHKTNLMPQYTFEGHETRRMLPPSHLLFFFFTVRPFFGTFKSLKLYDQLSAVEGTVILLAALSNTPLLRLPVQILPCVPPFQYWCFNIKRCQGVLPSHILGVMLVFSSLHHFSLSSSLSLGFFPPSFHTQALSTGPDFHVFFCKSLPCSRGVLPVVHRICSPPIPRIPPF